MELKPAHSLTLEELAALFNLAFTDYVGGSVRFNAGSLTRFLARDNVDLDLSQIVLRDGQPVGFGFIARQGWSSWLAAFGIVPAASGAGLGTNAMSRLIEQARRREDRLFELEVIEQNTRAVRLYESVGFRKLRRLIGYEASSPIPRTTTVGARRASPDLQTIDLLDAAKVIVQNGEADLPWSLTGFTIARHAPPDLAYVLDHAYAVISNPEPPVIALRALIVPPDYRRQGQAARLLSALFAQYPGKSWSIPAICPEEYGIFERFGFERQSITQFQMRLSLTS